MTVDKLEPSTWPRDPESWPCARCGRAVHTHHERGDALSLAVLALCPLYRDEVLTSCRRMRG